MTKALILVAFLFPALASATPTDDVIAAMKQADRAQMVRASPNLGAQGSRIAAACTDAVDKADREAAVTGRFKASGLTGDKLAWAIRWSKNDYDFYGVGGTILGPAQVKAARVMFLVTGDADHVWELHRFVFMGDKLMGTTQQQFLVRPGPSKFR